jgi:hypothetical protein
VAGWVLHSGRLGARARDRVLAQHTSERRADDLLAALADGWSAARGPSPLLMET